MSTYSYYCAYRHGWRFSRFAAAPTPLERTID